MSKLLSHIVFCISSLVFTIAAFAQPAASVRASINRDKILIGEPIELNLEAHVPLGSAAQWFPQDSLGHFEFIDKGKIDTIPAGEMVTYKQTLNITSFDSGRWTIPSLPLVIGNKEYLTDSLPVSVAYINFNQQQEYHDIKDIIEVEDAYIKYIMPAVIALAVLSLLLLIYFLRKKTNIVRAQPEKKMPVSKLSPLQEAMEALETLLRKLQNGQVQSKPFHGELNDVLRYFLYRKTMQPTMEKTSSELMLQLRQANINQENFTALAQVLRMNDAVKFAKYQPPAEENLQAVETVKQAVAALDKVIV